jgi:mono/diheme cytochrome c family protein
VRIAVASILVLALCACGGGAEEPEGEESSGGEAEGGGEGGAAYEGPITSTDVAHGKEVFETHCEDCHPGGEEDVGPSLIADPHTPARLRQQVREGSGKMRPFSEKRISADDLEALLAYLQTINAVK